MFARIFALFLIVIVALAAAAPQLLNGGVQTPVGGLNTNAGGYGAGLGSNVGGVPANANLGLGR